MAQDDLADDFKRYTGTLAIGCGVSALPLRRYLNVRKLTLKNKD